MTSMMLARKDLLAKVQSSGVPSDFRAVASSGEMVQFVSPALVVEVNCTDLQAEDSDGKPVRQWALSHGKDGWHRVCPVAGASMLHPVLSRVRSDKTVARPDVRVEQLAERVPIGDLDRKATVQTLPASEIVRREVYTKVAKGQTAVRKLLIWKTNKDGVDADFPAFVVHWTDYSSTRKAPLAREVRLAPSEDHAIAIAEQMVADNVKKGWELVD